MEKEKTLTLMDMIGMTLSAFVSMELISSMAAEGPSVILSFILIGGSFLFTHCVINAELGSTYPDQGGIYVWVQRGLGNKWAARTNWWYWLNVVGFVPSVMIPLVAIFQQLFWPEMTLGTTIILSIAGTWLIVLFNIIPLRNSKIVNNVGTVAKVIFCLALIIGAFVYAARGNAATEFTLSNMIPEFDLSLFALVPVFVYGLCGMDSIGVASEEMKNPKKDMPKAVIVSSVIAMLLYVFSTIATELVLPVDSIDATAGLIDAIMIVYQSSRLAVILIGVALGLLYFSNAFAWPLAANKAAQEAAESGEFPKIFAKSNKWGSPVGAAVILGIASTLLIIFYGLVANSNEDLFWNILAFTGIVFFSPYVVESVAFLKLRKNDPDRERPFRAPGNKFAVACTIFHMIILVGSCVSFLLPADGQGIGYTFMILGTLVGSQIIGEILMAYAEKQNKKGEE